MATKTLLILGILGLAALSPAPMKDQRRLNVTPERSQAQLAQEQSMQRVQGAVGETPRIDQGYAPVAGKGSDPAAGDVLRAAAVGNAGAAEVVAESGKRLDERKGRSRTPFLLGGSMLMLGFGAIFALRQWADRKLGEPPASKRVSW